MRRPLDSAEIPAFPMLLELRSRCSRHTNRGRALAMVTVPSLPRWFEDKTSEEMRHPLYSRALTRARAVNSVRLLPLRSRCLKVGVPEVRCVLLCTQRRRRSQNMFTYPKDFVQYDILQDLRSTLVPCWTSLDESYCWMNDFFLWSAHWFWVVWLSGWFFFVIWVSQWLILSRTISNSESYD